MTGELGKYYTLTANKLRAGRGSTLPKWTDGLNRSEIFDVLPSCYSTQPLRETLTCFFEKEAPELLCNGASNYLGGFDNFRLISQGGLANFTVVMLYFFVSDK
ncbi:hypothetical protein P691DRAFT_290511 [Macrolepiota fuliginosa MF-IS2]|uniref:Uncharacterized protein n=1 Tax=Macrolepiota fuliginosa MF-IS2 TaxID=1400762 RepID=A0A9P5X7J4_9AGAR|nr:hypothetical protein P691DRAFT_290511 [Macrolepiota fuliginosa MF-IS2]